MSKILRLFSQFVRKFKDQKFILCSECFNDQGLKLDAFQIGLESKKACVNCTSYEGKKLTGDLVAKLAYRFFVVGTIHKTEFGAAPVIQFNEHQLGDELDVNENLKTDILLIQSMIKVGFFYYGPRLWMVGEVEPLKWLQSKEKRQNVIDRIIREYPNKNFSRDDMFFRVRKNPKMPQDNSEYDSPPSSGTGRLDTEELPVLYCSQDLEVCVHECRVTVEDQLFVATLSPKSTLKLLDLTEVLAEDGTEFESLDIAIHMVFYASMHSYDISRAIAKAIKGAGFDGIIYPSYFSTMRTGAVPFSNVYGLSIRKIPMYSQFAKSQIVPNLAIFGRPIIEEKVEVRCINRIHLNKVKYDLQFGPVKF